MRKLFLVLVVCCSNLSESYADNSGTWQIALDANGFKALKQGPEQGSMDSQVIGAVSARQAIGQAMSGVVKPSGKGILFQIGNTVPDRKTLTWSLAAKGENAKGTRYFKICYKASGFFRDYTEYNVISIFGKDESGKVVSEKLLDSAQILNDDQWHVLIGKRLLNFSPEKLDVKLSTTDSLCSLSLDMVEFSVQPAVDAFAESTEEQKAGATKRDSFFEIDLTSLYNDSFASATARTLEKHAAVVDACDYFKSNRFTVYGIPFNVNPDGNNIITSPDKKYLNQEQVDFMGHKVTRQFFFPVSRDEAITVKIDRRASEVFLLLTADFPAATSRYGLAKAPYYFDDVDMFSAEIIYEGTDPDIAMPFSITDNGYIIRRAAGIYAIAADQSRSIKNIIFRNRHFGGTVSIGALTVNTSSSRLFPELVQEPKQIATAQLQQPKQRDAFVSKQGQRVVLGNSYYEVVADCNDGWNIQSFVNRWSAKVPQQLDPNSGLELIFENRILNGRDFSVHDINLVGNQVTFSLKSKAASVPVELTILLKADKSPELVSQIAVKNTSTSAKAVQIRFPYFANVRLGSVEDTWLYFPQYRNVWTNQNGNFLANNDHCYPMQFFDIYNPKEGLGIALITHNLTNNPIDYSMLKTDGGASAFIQYHKEFYTVEPGKEIKLPETAIVSHNGDWRQAVNAYQGWVKTWYQHRKLSERREWFNRISLLKDYFLSEKICWKDLKIPPMFNNKTKQFQFDDYLGKDKEYWGGLTPDMIHFFHWSVIDTDKSGEQDWGQYTYDNFGGLDNFKAGISRLQNEFKTPVSLYMVPDRCSTGTESGKRLGAKAVKLRPDGSELANAEIWYVCPEQKDWMEWFVETAAKVQNDTGADVMYFDVVGFWRSNTCYAKNHGHAVPSWYNQTTHELISRLRQALPAHVAIWTEYPLTDYNTQYSDGNIQYYYLTLHELFAKPYDVLERPGMYSEPAMSLYRFIFPHIKQIDLPIGNENAVNYMNRLKFTFFNGEAIYDNGWLSMTDMARNELMIKSVAIKKQFADCFYSSDVTPLVPTERAYVYANRFTGPDKTVWTIYNGRYSSLRGPVLAIEHKKGSKYFDAWNNKALKPRILMGKAVIECKLDPQGLGCIVQYDK